MAYFNELLDVQYLSFLQNRQKSEEYVRAKNLFRKAKLRDDLSKALVLFQQYEIPDGLRPDNVAEELYGNAEYDWIVLITAEITNIRDEWPSSDADIYQYCVDTYGDELYNPHHYETLELKDENKRTILSSGSIVNYILQSPYPTYPVELNQELLNIQDNPIGFNVSGNLYVYDSETLVLNNDWGKFTLTEDVNLPSGGTWFYQVDVDALSGINLLQSQVRLTDSIEYLARDGYLKTVTINIDLEDTGSGITTTVSSTFNSTQQSYVTYYEQVSGRYTTYQNITRSVSNYEYEIEKNNSKRSINVLRPEYVQDFVSDIRRLMVYKNSSQLVEDENGEDIIRVENVRNSRSYGNTFRFRQ